jgi:hypothetical protein
VVAHLQRGGVEARPVAGLAVGIVKGFSEPW